MTATIIVGEALRRLRELPDESVQCVVTSPPYWGLRDYGTAQWEGGDPGCDHLHKTGGSAASTLGVMSGGNAISDEGVLRSIERSFVPYASRCAKCGATRTDEQLGLEATPEEFVARLVEIMREVRRVLRRDGVCWLNIGDCYAGGGRGDGADSSKQQQNVGSLGFPPQKAPPGLKTKDLVMVPARLALALQADGWWVRSEVVWAKPNPMPESIEDRPTQAHEKVFLLARSRRYFYDAVAIREASPESERRRGDVRKPTERDRAKLENGHNGHGYSGNRGDQERGGGRNRRNVWEVAEELWPQFLRWLEGQPAEVRDVWEVPAHGFADAHFATFPAKLVEPCVLAGSSPRACGVCGAPWQRQVERTYVNPGNRSTNGPRSLERKHEEHGTAGYGQRLEAQVRTVGWVPTCEHDDDSGRCVVLDPFAGSGTVGVVCEWHGRDFVGLELNPEYAEMARRRIATDGALRRPAYRPEPEPEDQLSLEGLP